MALSLAGRGFAIQGATPRSRITGRSKRAGPRLAIRAASNADQPVAIPDALAAIASGKPVVEVLSPGAEGRQLLPPRLS